MIKRLLPKKARFAIYSFGIVAGGALVFSEFNWFYLVGTTYLIYELIALTREHQQPS